MTMMAKLFMLITTMISFIACTPTAKVMLMTTKRFNIRTNEGIEEIHRPGSGSFTPFCEIDSFDLNSKILKKTFINSYNVVESTLAYKYDSRGNQITQQLIGFEYQKQYTYDSVRGLRIEKTYFDTSLYDSLVFDRNNRLIESWLSHNNFRTIYFYDSLSGLFMKSETFTDSKLTRVIEVLYDKDNNKIEARYIDKGDVSFILRSKYKGKNRIEMSEYSKNENIPVSSTFYDKHGNVIKETNVHGMHVTYLYKYNRYREWVEMKEYANGKPTNLTTREIEYYKR